MTRNYRCLYACLFNCLLAVACAAPSRSADAESIDTLSSALGAEQYVDVLSFFTKDDDVNRWYSLTAALRNDFDNICGDTFCEGDYSNYESLGFRCSVGQAGGSFAQCMWVFAASIEDIDPATGNLDVHGEIWHCPMPLAAQTSPSQLLEALSAPGEQPLFAPLPGSQLSLYDGLTSCL